MAVLWLQVGLGLSKAAFVASHPLHAVRGLQAHGTVYALDKLLASVGEIVHESLQDPDMPASVRLMIDRTYDQIWENVKQGVKEAARSAVLGADESFRKRLTRFRANAPSFWPRGGSIQPYTWLRAKLLYTLMPSDGTFWTTLKDPWCSLFKVLLLLPVSGCLLFVLVFFMIRKRDEFQLVQYITAARAMQSIALGAFGLIVAGVKFYGCLRDLDEAIYQHQALGELPEMTFCADDAPGGPHDLLTRLTLAAEPLRLCTVWCCYYLLLSGYARGGKAHLVVLETVREDAADGTVDGALDEGAATQRAMENVDDDADNDAEPVHEDHLFAWTERDIKLLPARHGLHMRWFALWDVGCFGALLGWWLLSSLRTDRHAWMLWTDVFYLFTAYSLLMLPFIVLAIPAVAIAISGAMPTGYDRSGALGAVLSVAEIQAKRDFEEALRRQSHNPSYKAKARASAARQAALDHQEERRQYSNSRVRGALRSCGLANGMTNDTHAAAALAANEESSSNPISSGVPPLV